MADGLEWESIRACPACGTELAPRLLTCPACHRLVHAERLKRLAAEADEAERAEDLLNALARWRSALELLPPGTRQHAVIAARVNELSRRVETTPGEAVSAAPQPGRSASSGSWNSGAGAAGLGGLALLAWKFKFLLIFVATKAKFLIFGLTKASTFLSMLASLGVYWTAFGWRLAAGLVISIYIHEMGHVAELRKYGIRASAPLFIPGFGAVVRLQQSFDNPRQDARVGLAGPLWGLGAAVAALVVWLGAGAPIWAAIAKLGAFLNLFNLLPVWQLDGGRAFHSLTRPQRALAAASAGIAWLAVSNENDPMSVWLLAIAILGGARAMFGAPAKEHDWGALVTYVLLVAGLSAFLLIPVRV